MSVLAGSEYLQPSLRSAVEASASHREVALAVGRHVVWERRVEEVWEELSVEDSWRVERGYVAWVSAGAAMCGGWDESKGDDGGGVEVEDASWSVRLGDGSMVLLRSMRMVAAAAKGAGRWPVRREVKVEYAFPVEWPAHATNCEMVALEADSEEYKEVMTALVGDVERARVTRIER